MLISLEQVLSKDEVSQFRTELDAAAWQDGAATAGTLARAVKHNEQLAAGDMVLYPSSSLHRVTPVTRGARVAAFFWIESLVADEAERSLLFDLDQSVQQLTPLLAADDLRLVQLTGVYHNLLRRWAKP